MYRILRNRVFLGLDLVAWSIIPLAALSLRLDFSLALDRYLHHLLAFTALGIVCKFTTLWSFGLYRRLWRYASIDELVSIAGGVLVAGLIAGLTYFALVVPLLPDAVRLPRSVPIVDALLTLLLFGGSRFTVRAMECLWQRRRGWAGAERVVIVGAGEGGMMIAKELRANPQLRLEPVGFVDDDPLKQGRMIQGLPVFGDRSQVPAIAKEYKLDKAIIAMPTAPGPVIREIRDICDSAGLTTKTIPGVFEIISGRVKVSQLRDVEIEDLLRREPVVTDQEAVAKLVRGATVLVTGAGGSIGSEICRQVARLGVRELILLDHAENPVFHIHNELTARYPAVRAVPVIADVRHGRRVSRAFETHRPQVVFHAAAHKHVPLMELNPEEAVLNNVVGTMNLLAAAEAADVAHFVLISTDKAVNPGNIMGATKLIAEMLVHEAAVRAGKHYVSVRFGNVLGSEGSVVPLFQEQIARGGPVTVTHPDMVRYFMTIPEAVQLVLQAAAMGRAGETFVLDMGEPVRILDLAKDLIEVSGLELGKDIEIVFSGLRPGENMYEELFLPEEIRGHTGHEKVFVARNGNGRTLRGNSVTRLIAAAEVGDLAEVRRHLAELLPGLRASWNGNGAGQTDGGELVVRMSETAEAIRPVAKPGS